MGRTVTPKYAVHVETVNGLMVAPFAWSAREHGKPTAANLARFIETYNKSFGPGGANAHLKGTRITRAILRRNERDGAAIAEWPAVEGREGFYVWGRHTSAAWYPTRAEAEAEARKMNYRGGTHYTVRPASRPGEIGIPYAEAGVRRGFATSTCPACGLVCEGVDHKASARAYGLHYKTFHS